MRAVLYLRAVAAMVLPLTVDVLVPAALLGTGGGRFDAGWWRFDADWWRFAGIPLVALGCWLLLDSVFLRFAREGRGTLAPVDPPQRVVRGGAYRVVRNPMYVANVAILLGIGLLFRSWYVLTWAAIVFVAFHAFVVGYEEPALRRQFGDAYDAYRRRVGRWLPRVRPHA
jgi:protein-S-isoprenylcysteine O-methyltransferase Ste14